ncbi:uncharacterized protein LOC131231740 [Magnolia sinica]|uniref:uncharacterized protein LOC131231740 n=1 Tax=Magnolia sinica TaxID=86752 RepID=UPI002657CDF0|nr:uncharacterized protein LOC131231740 [Magnolia sinica]
MVSAETRYSPLKKLALSFDVSAQRLRPYFQAHSVVMLTDSPLKQVLQRPEVSGQLTRWAIELGEFDIQFRPKTAIKGQAIADFIVEFTTPSAREVSAEGETIAPEPSSNLGTVWETRWILYVDGSSNAKRARAGIVLIAPNSTSIQYAIRLGFKASNNEAEYEALLAGLKLAASLGIQTLAENSWADALAKLASASKGRIPQIVLVEIIEHPSIDQAEKKTVNPGQATLSWMDPIFNYLTSGEIPSDKLEVRCLRVRPARYVVLDGILYKKGHSQPYLRCLRPDEADYVIRKIHEEICGNRSGSRALALKILQQGYFWLTLKQDSKDYVQKYDKCQCHSAMPRKPAEEMTPMSGPWPFGQWRIDIIGPLPIGKGQVKFAIVVVDYFTKWAEGEPVAKITKWKVEAINKVIKHHLKTKLKKSKGRWAEELSFILWAYRTTVQSSTGETPFLLSYGSEAMAPVEIGLPTVRVKNYQENQNSEQITANLDLLEEVRDISGL